MHKYHNTIFVFDVESIGLHGEAFAVAGGVYSIIVLGSDSRKEPGIDGHARVQTEPISEFCFGCPRDRASGSLEDRKWVGENVPIIYATHRNPAEVRAAFWGEWEQAKRNHPGIPMMAECLWPVEARFLMSCIEDDLEGRTWEGPYPFHEISSYMAAAGMDPMRAYPRKPEETPAHHPLKDARQSARLYFWAQLELSVRNEIKKALKTEL